MKNPFNADVSFEKKTIEKIAIKNQYLKSFESLLINKAVSIY